MPKFKIITSSTVACSYTVEAPSAERAQEMYEDGEAEILEEQHELSDYLIDSQEEVLEVQEVEE